MPDGLPILVETNRVIRQFAEGTGRPTTLWQFLCECGCYELVELTLAEFDAAEHVLARGHRLPGLPLRSL